MGENTDEADKSYNLYEKSIYPDWDMDLVPDDVDLEEEDLSLMPNEIGSEDGGIPFAEGEREIFCLHKELLNSAILTKDYVLVGTKCINISSFNGYVQTDETGLFPEGISMSLWKSRFANLAFIVGTSDQVSYIGVLTERGGEYGALQGEISFNECKDQILNVPLKFYFLNKKQEFIGLLEKWAEGIQGNAKVTTLDRYMVLTNYQLNGLGTLYAWRNMEELQNPLLYLITNSMLSHLNRTSLNNENALLKEWLINNTIIPRHH